jgi:deoxycytidylate deaminase
MAEAILSRSTCHVQVGAVISDNHGIFGWGWNHAGADGLGLCAERHCLKRANRERFHRATMWVAGQWYGKDKVVPSKPCAACERAIRNAGVKKVMWRDKDGKWRKL